MNIAYTLRLDPITVLTETNRVHRAARLAAAQVIIRAKKKAQTTQ